MSSMGWKRLILSIDDGKRVPTSEMYSVGNVFWFSKMSFCCSKEVAVRNWVDIHRSMLSSFDAGQLAGKGKAFG